MKKVILMSGIAFFAVVALSSCKKDRTCQCDSDYSYTISNQTKKKAKEICEGDVNVGVISVSGDNGCYLL